MSGDWIKMRVDLRTHPKVVRMASALKADKLRVVGALYAVWSIFDAHSPDGVLEGYTFRTIDVELGWKGFAQAMSAVDWLAELDDSVSVPRFGEHNGQSAKRRATETERKRLEREAEKEAAIEAERLRTESGQTSASYADEKRTREEKRREEEPKPRNATRSVGQEPDDGQQIADKPKVNGHDAKIKRTQELKADAKQILEFLNDRAGKRFPETDSNIGIIVARFKEGFSPLQVRQVVAMKVREWKGDEEMAKYLRPETLFGRTKFSGYVGELGGDDDAT